MDAIVVEGGHPLTGQVRVGGAKNSALKLMAAALLAPGVTTLRNVPDISDVAVMAEVLERLGAHVVRTDHTLTIDARPGFIPTQLDADISGLDIGGAVRVGDLVLPEGVTTEVDPDEQIAIGSATRAAIAGEDGEPAEAVEGGEAGEAEGAADDASAE